MSDSAYARLYAGIREFLRMEAAGGIALGLAALLITIAIGIGSALFGGDDGPCRPDPQTGLCRN